MEANKSKSSGSKHLRQSHGAKKQTNLNKQKDWPNQDLLIDLDRSELTTTTGIVPYRPIESQNSSQQQNLLRSSG